MHQERSVWRNRDGGHVGIIFLGRTIIFTLLVFATWNPSGYSFVSFAWTSHPALDTPEGLLLAVWGAILLVGWIWALRTMSYYLHRRVFVIMALAVVIVWSGLIYAAGLSTHGALQTLIWAMLLALGILMGLATSHRELKNFKRRLAPSPRSERAH